MRVFRDQDAIADPSSMGLFGAFFEHVPEPMLVLDSNLAIVTTNRAARVALGLTNDGSGRSMTDFCAMPDSTRPSCTLRQAIDRGPVSCEPELLCRRADGSTYPAAISASQFELDGTSLVAVVITDRSASEAALAVHERERALYESLFQLTPIPLREEDFSNIGRWFNRLRAAGVTDLGDHVRDNPGDLMDAILGIKTIRVNRAMLDLMGAKKPEELESFSRDEMTDEVLDSFREEFTTLWNGGSLHEAEFIGLDLHGRPFECRLTLSARSTDGVLDFSRVIVAIQDITQVRAYQRTLENLIAGKDRFVASISHELRTPLATVLGLSQELYDLWDEFDADESRELMGLIALGANDLATLVEDLLLAAQIEVGDTIPSNPEEFDLVAVANTAVEECIAAGDLSVRPQIDSDEIRCFADPGRVGQIVRNLVSNAARYGGGKVEIILASDPQPSIQVLDDGPGLPPEEWERIFNPYEQVIGTDGTRGALGLGLAISRQLAEIMNCSLTYRYVNETSFFTLTLPGIEESL